jgi:MFS transporter, AAHS family, 4-hydroxybenzoate transporter
LRPDLSISLHTRFSVGLASVSASRGTPARLFAGTLAVITPALWIVLAANQFANFFALSWLPTLLQSAGLSTAQAGISASMFSIGGLAGGLILTFIIDRFGVLPIIGLFLLGAPLVASMGMEGVSPWALGAIIAAAGFCVTGNNFAINAAMVMIYPTHIRATGTGWAQGMGRMGSLGAPILGGILLGMHLLPQQLYYAPALALLVGAAAAGVLIVFCIRRFGGYRLDEAAAVATEESSNSPRTALNARNT